MQKMVLPVPLRRIRLILCLGIIGASLALTYFTLHLRRTTLATEALDPRAAGGAWLSHAVESCEAPHPRAYCHRHGTSSATCYDNFAQWTVGVMGFGYDGPPTDMRYICVDFALRPDDNPWCTEIGGRSDAHGRVEWWNCTRGPIRWTLETSYR